MTCIDLGDINEIRKLIDELLALIHEWAGVLSGRLSGRNLCVHRGDLGGERVDLTDRLGHGKIDVALQGGEVCRDLIERASEILRRSQDTLTGVEVARIRGEPRQTVEEIRERAL